MLVRPTPLRSLAISALRNFRFSTQVILAFKDPAAEEEKLEQADKAKAKADAALKAVAPPSAGELARAKT